MKNCIVFCLFQFCSSPFLFGQETRPGAQQQKAITSLIDQYSLARETRDTVLLKQVLTTDVDQLVSSGEWRTGIAAAIQGMLRSSASSPGTRTLTVDKIRMLSDAIAVVDCRYEIENAANTRRKMWSSFIVIGDKESWKIAAIRNMLPAMD